MIFRVSILVLLHLQPVPFLRSPSENEKSKLLQEDEVQDEGTEMFNSKNIEMELNPKLIKKIIGEKSEHSQNLVMELEMEKSTLERRLLELYSLKEKLYYIACLQRNLDDKTAEIEKLEFAIFALRDEIKDLKEYNAGSLEVKQLDMEKKMIVEMQMKNGNASQMKRQIFVLQEQLSGFAANETSVQDASVEKRLEAIKDIELQVLKMRRINKELELEKREISFKLYAAHAKVSALSDMKEIKTIAKISELRHVNGDLLNEVERLQKSRFAMVEELVYQRWLNACLRAEIKHHQERTCKRKFSTSMVPSNTSMLSAKLGGTYGKKNVSAPKELTETMKMPDLTKKGYYEKGIVSLVTEDRSSAKTGALAGKKHESPSEIAPVEPNQSSDHSNRRSIDNDDGDAKEVSRVVSEPSFGWAWNSVST
ncbi:protein CHUP1, chloroplastic-like [Hibiscus syriacus]|uniref:protein CHUP1, chloroplastic-like n=1 Tax=Hibiscus syriacus TaxID=106335 RepID=UPI001920E379|nr:protein CHUP1, chloroplastic-like [Hibiscus syriacus]